MESIRELIYIKNILGYINIDDMNKGKDKEIKKSLRTISTIKEWLDKIEEQLLDKLSD